MLKNNKLTFKGMSIGFWNKWNSYYRNIDFNQLIFSVTGEFHEILL